MRNLRAWRVATLPGNGLGQCQANIMRQLMLRCNKPPNGLKVPKRAPDQSRRRAGHTGAKDSSWLPSTRRFRQRARMSFLTASNS